MIPIRYRIRTTAFHEAGHAFAAVHYGIPYLKVWILKRTDFENRSGELLGQLTRINEVNKPDYFGKLDAAKAEATLAFCGPLAECLAYPGQLGPDLGGENLGDWHEARSFLRFATTLLPTPRPQLLTDSHFISTAAKVNQLLEECGRAAEVLVNGNKEAITRLAEALLVLWEIPAEEAKQILSGT